MPIAPLEPGLPAKPKPGRPPVFSEAERSKRILDAAERVFTRDGYGATTMEEVARVAGMAKKTVYRLFRDKEHLFAVLISDADAFPDGTSPASRSDPTEALRDHLLALAEFVLSPRQVAMTRLLISEARHSPERADEFYARVMRKGQQHQTECLARVLGASRAAQIGDLDGVAMALFGAALGGLHLSALFGRQDGFPREQLVAQIDRAIALMLPGLLGTPDGPDRQRQPAPEAVPRAQSRGQTGTESSKPARGGET